MIYPQNGQLVSPYMKTVHSHCKCKSKSHVRIEKEHFPFFGSLLIALLPKCPFCLLAYTSAITVCSAKTLTHDAPEWTSYISIVLAIVTLLIVAYNYKGTRTWISGTIIMLGIMLITYSELYTRLLGPYYWGCGLLLFGVWINGSFNYFLAILISKMKWGEPRLHYHGQN